MSHAPEGVNEAGRLTALLPLGLPETVRAVPQASTGEALERFSEVDVFRKDVSVRGLRVCGASLRPRAVHVVMCLRPHGHILSTSSTSGAKFLPIFLM